MKILIIQQKMIGDVLTSSILFQAIKTKYPDAELHYLINSHTYPVVAHHPFIDEFIFFTPEHQKSTFQVFKLGLNLKKQSYNVVIDVYSKLSSNLMSILSGAKVKISLDKGFNSLIYKHCFKSKPNAETNAGLAVENRLQLLKPIGVDVSKIYRPKIYLTDDEKHKAKIRLEESKLDLNRPIFMISALGSSPKKTYPPQYMARVIDTLVELHPDCQILFNYIPNQLKDAERIYHFCKSKSHIYFDVFGRSLREFLAITLHCQALVGNEGGAVNMAKALGVNTFTIFSPWIEKEVWNMFDDGKNHVSVHLNDFKPEVYKNVNRYKDLKRDAVILYREFKPTLFSDLLKTFLLRLN